MTMRSLFALITLIFVVWLATPVALILFFGKPESAGTFGDLFGSINALFTGLAFGGLIFTIKIQLHEFRLQKEELRLTRDELKKSSKSQQQSADALAKQLANDQVKRDMEVLLREFDNLNSDWGVAVRREIFCSSDIDKFLSDAQVLMKVEKLLNYLNHIGYLISKDLFPKEAALEIFYITIVRIWSKLGNHVVGQRVNRGFYQYHFEWLAFESLSYWQKSHPEAKIFIHNQSNNSRQSIDREILIKLLEHNQDTVIRYVTKARS